jgi:hypothetical protein
MEAPSEEFYISKSLKVWAIEKLPYDYESRYKSEALSLRVLEPIPFRNGMKTSMASLRS